MHATSSRKNKHRKAQKVIIVQPCPVCFLNRISNVGLVNAKGDEGSA